MASTLKINNLDTASGTTITIPTGKTLVGTDEGTIRTPGAVLQVKQSVLTGTATYNNSASVSDIAGLAVTITPKSTSSKILITFQISYSTSTDGCGNLIQLQRGSTNLGGATSGTVFNGVTGVINNHGQANSGGQIYQTSGEFLDSPSTTSATTYKLRHYGVGGTTPFALNKNESGQLGGISTITVTEIAG